MENSTDSFAKTRQALADRAADKAQSSVQIAHETATHARGVLSGKLEDVRSEAGTVVDRGSKRVQSATKQSLDAITETAGQAREVAANATDSIVTYTKGNPLKALAFAAIVGALLYATIKTLAPSRD